MNKHKIIRVLEFIKDYCNEKNSCEKCPFHNSNFYACNLTMEGTLYPAQWDVGNIKENLNYKERID